MWGWALVAVSLTAAEWANPLPGSTRGFRLGDAPWFAVYVAVSPALAWLGSRASDGARWTSPEPLAAAPLGVRIVVGLVVYDLVAYWLHRAMHTTQLWWLHRVHHASRGLSWWTAFRAHPLSAVLMHVVPLASIAILGVGPEAAAAVVATVFAVTLLGHADVWVPPALEWVVATPAYHRRHHEAAHGGHNLALLFPVIDLAFGTCVMSPGTPARRGPRTSRSRSHSSPGTATTIAAAHD